MIASGQFEAEEKMQIARAQMVKQQDIAEKVVPAQIEKQQREIRAEADAEVARRTAAGDADAVFAEMEAQARGVFEGLKAKAHGFKELEESCNDDPDATATMLVVEKLETLVEAQVEAIKNIKIDKVVVWDNLANGKSSTAEFLSGLVKSLPPLHDLADNVGIDLPDYLGKISEINAVQPDSAQSAGGTTPKKGNDTPPDAGPKTK